MTSSENSKWVDRRAEDDPKKLAAQGKLESFFGGGTSSACHDGSYFPLRHSSSSDSTLLRAVGPNLTVPLSTHILAPKPIRSAPQPFIYLTLFLLKRDLPLHPPSIYATHTHTPPGTLPMAHMHPELRPCISPHTPHTHSVTAPRVSIDLFEPSHVDGCLAVE